MLFTGHVIPMRFPCAQHHCTTDAVLQLCKRHYVHHKHASFTVFFAAFLAQPDCFSQAHHCLTLPQHGTLFPLFKAQLFNMHWCSKEPLLQEVQITACH